MAARAAAVEPTWTNETVSSITSGRTIAAVTGGVIDTTVPWRYSVQDMAPVDATYAGIWSSRSQTGTRTVIESRFRVDFDFDGQAFEIKLVHRALLQVRLIVDGLITGFQPGLQTDANGFIKVDFGSRALRRITIDFDFRARFGGLVTAPTDSVSPPSWKGAGKIAFFGDSQTNGQYSNATTASTGAASANGYPNVVSDLLGFTDFRNFGVGGSGYIAQTGAAAPAYPYRLADITDFAPDVLVIQSSINDLGQTNTDVTNAVTSFLNSIKAALPQTKIIVTGPMFPAGAATYATLNSTIKAAVTALGLPYVDIIADNIFRGTGKTGTATGDGNADLYRYSDGTHTVQAGHMFFSSYLAGKIASILGMSSA